MTNFLKISQFYAMLDALLHIADVATSDIAKGFPDSQALQHVAAHLDAFTTVVDKLGDPVNLVVTEAQDIATAISPPKV